MRKDITGCQFGSLKAMYDTGRSDQHRNAIWRFRCVCGNEVELSVLHVKSGNVKSCGCIYRQRRSVAADGRCRKIDGAV